MRTSAIRCTMQDAHRLLFEMEVAYRREAANRRGRWHHDRKRYGLALVSYSLSFSYRIYYWNDGGEFGPDWSEFAD